MRKISNLTNYSISQLLFPIAQSFSSRIQTVQHSWKRDGLADVFETTDPGYRSFDSHAEAAVRDAAEFSEVEIPLKRFFR